MVSLSPLLIGGIVAVLVAAGAALSVSASLGSASSLEAASGGASGEPSGGCVGSGIQSVLETYGPGPHIGEWARSFARRC